MDNTPIIASKKVTKYILQRFGLKMSKRLGQNFLIDAGIVEGIVRAANITAEDRILEIGPGIGTLTQMLAQTGANITAVELDKRLPDILAHTLEAYPNVNIVQGDILKVDIATIMDHQPFKVVANLPYYITTPIIMELFERQLPITDIVVMVQKEVAERMIAEPGSKTYGALSVAVQYYSTPAIVLDVPPGSFMPPPEVDSAVVRCRIASQRNVATTNEKLFFQVVRAAFGQRRKTLNNALKTLGLSKEIISQALSASHIDEARRGETLSLEEFAKLADEINNLRA